jgi:hypothetical protein
MIDRASILPVLFALCPSIEALALRTKTYADILALFPCLLAGVAYDSMITLGCR